MNNEMKWYQILACCLITAIIMFIAVIVTSPAFAEERRVEVKFFDLASAEVVLEDEDGFLWSFDLGKRSWYLGQEFVMVLEEGKEPNLRDC